MASVRKLLGLVAAASVIPMAVAQVSSSCTCPSVGNIFTTTVFYDPNTVGTGTMGTGTMASATGITNSIGTGGTGGATGSTAVASPSSTALTPNVLTVVRAIQSITSQSQALQSPASSLTTTNGPLIAIGQGPLPGIIAGFSNIVSTATAAVPALQALGSVTDSADSDAIFDVFRDFVTVHQALLSILIGKSGLFSTVPIVGQPVAAALRSIEMVVDAVANGLINAVQSQADNLQSEASSLDGTLANAIQSYGGAQTSNVVRL